MVLFDSGLVSLSNIELTISYPEDGGIMFLQSIGTYLPDYIM
jgi:hypothetical protein